MGERGGSTAASYAGFPVVVDIELTSRCNARCSFCPRDQTPHQGLIDGSTFDAALGRAVEYRDAIRDFQALGIGGLATPDDTIWLSFCGMGEPLLHPRVVEYVARVADAGLRPIINTNAALLHPSLADELLDAGLAMACCNVGEVDDDYEAVYRLPFERTRANVDHLLAVAGDRCTVRIVLVDHRGDPAHVDAVRAYWSERGAERFLPFTLVNRGGSLATDGPTPTDADLHRQAAGLLPEEVDRAGCPVPFLYPFIGYDGTYHLCSSDWRKEVDLGSVFERSLVDLFDDKAERARTRSPICRDCTNEPRNAVALAVGRATDGSSTDAADTPDALVAQLVRYQRWVSALRHHLPPTATGGDRVPRRLIAVRS